MHNLGPKTKKIILGALGLVLVFGSFLGSINLVKAQQLVSDVPMLGAFGIKSVADAAWQVTDLGLRGVNKTEDWIDKYVIKPLSAFFIKNLLGNFAQIVAQQSAVYIASGDPGQAPLFYDTKNFLMQATDAVLGDALNQLAKDITGFDLCQFNLKLVLDLAFDLPMFDPCSVGSDPQNPNWKKMGFSSQPFYCTSKCSLTQMANNLSQISADKMLDLKVDLDIGMVEVGKTVGNMAGNDPFVEGTIFPKILAPMGALGKFGEAVNPGGFPEPFRTDLSNDSEEVKRAISLNAADPWKDKGGMEKKKTEFLTRLYNKLRPKSKDNPESDVWGVIVPPNMFYYTGPASTYFEGDFSRAVAEFQKDKMNGCSGTPKICESGQINPATAANMGLTLTPANTVLKMGDTNDVIKKLKELMRKMEKPQTPAPITSGSIAAARDNALRIYGPCKDFFARLTGASGTLDAGTIAAYVKATQEASNQFEKTAYYQQLLNEIWACNQMEEAFNLNGNQILKNEGGTDKLFKWLDLVKVNINNKSTTQPPGSLTVDKISVDMANVYTRSFNYLKIIQETALQLADQANSVYDLELFKNQPQLTGAERLGNLVKGMDLNVSETGLFLELGKNMYDRQFAVEATDKLWAGMSEGMMKPITEKISGQVTDPSGVTRDISTKKIETPNYAAQYTGEVIADTLGVFIMTLSNELMMSGVTQLSKAVAKNMGKDAGKLKIAAAALEQIAQKIKDKNEAARKQALNFYTPFDERAKACDIGQKAIDAIFGRVFPKDFGTYGYENDSSCKKAEETTTTTEQSAGGTAAAGAAASREATTLATADLPILPLDTEDSSPVPGDVAGAWERHYEAMTKGISPEQQLGKNIMDDFVACPPSGTNPNIYNCVMDSRLRMAIDKGLTIQEAMSEKNKFIDGSWYVARKPQNEEGVIPKYNEGFSLSNIKKMRLARIFPLGLELAAQLAEDCWARKADNKGDYSDITESDFNGTGLCVFKPYSTALKEQGLSVDDIKKFNQSILNDIIPNTTFAKIVQGFGQWGDGICGDMDFTVVDGRMVTQESPFCNLVDPSWILKMPISRCEKQEWDNSLVSADNNERQIRCTDVTSCLNEDINGNCSGGYGYCVKEANSWEFSATSCPSYYNSCRTYYASDKSRVDYLSNTLVANGCKYDNAGCNWYSTWNFGNWHDLASYLDQDTCESAGGIWDAANNRCNNSRIYLTRYAGKDQEQCDGSQIGCSQLLTFRDAGNNLAADGGFENSQPKTIPKNWQGGIKILSTGVCNGQLETGNDGKLYCLKNSEIVKNVCQTVLTEAQCTGATLRKNGGKCYKINSDSEECHSPMAGKWLGYGPFDYINNIQVVSDKEPFEGANVLKWPVSSYAGTPPETDYVVLSYKIAYSKPGEIIIKGGDTYTVSLRLKTANGGSVPVRLSLAKTYLGARRDINYKDITVNPFWSDAYTSSVTLTALSDGTDLILSLEVPPGSKTDDILIDAVQIQYNDPNSVLSGANLVNDYKNYTANNNLFLKIPPAYFQCTGSRPDNPPKELSFTQETSCLDNGGFWDKNNVYGQGNRCYTDKPDNQDCYRFARACLPEEVGCQLFTPKNGDPAIPGVVANIDYCPAECVGYSTYKRDITKEKFVKQIAADNLYRYFIPATARLCSAAAVGCSEFTNLDEVAKGGEGKEYYSELKQCIKPGLGLGEKTYFSWQGSNNSAPVLKTYVLASADDGSPKTADNSGDCLVSSDNLACILFFDDAGKEYPRQISQTISVSDDCHPYRKTVADQTNCRLSNGAWQNDSCIYYVIPQQGSRCSQSEIGCVEYIGNKGRNVRPAEIFDNFDDFIDIQEASNGWYSGETGSADLAGLSVVGEAISSGGHSLFVPADVSAINKSIAYNRSQSLVYGQQYTLSFWAKSATNNPKEIEVLFTGATSVEKKFASLGSGKVVVDGEWRSYNLGPVLFDWTIAGDPKLILRNISGGLYLDNITLRISADSEFVIDQSWQTPASCDINFFGVSQPQAMLGCQAYTDVYNQTHNLKSFTRLCRQGSIGCHLLIDTKNSSNPNAEEFNTTANNTRLDDVLVPADELVSVVVADAYRCQANVKGCQYLGFPTLNSETNKYVYTPVPLINDPDKYIVSSNPLLCKAEELGCNELIDENGQPAYFKLLTGQSCKYSTGGNLVNGEIVTGWFVGDSKIGCAASGDTESTCTKPGQIWSKKYQQCTSSIFEFPATSDVCMGKLSTATEFQKSEYANNVRICEAYEKGFWYDKPTACGCAKSPFSTYLNTQAENFNVRPALCGDAASNFTPDNSRCTGFTEFNPTYIFNGDFELTLPADKSIILWDNVNIANGYRQTNFDKFRSGNSAVSVYKSSAVGAPASEDSRFYIKQQINNVSIKNVEGDVAYMVNFDYYAGDDTKPGTECAPVMGKVEIRTTWDYTTFSKVIRTKNIDAKGAWQHEKLVFSIPENGNEGSKNLELRLYAPAKEACPDSYVIYDNVQFSDITAHNYYVIDDDQGLDRQSCREENWEKGCVRFVNTLSSKDEILQVKKNRICGEWLYCEKNSRDANGMCAPYRCEKDGQVVADKKMVKTIQECTELGYTASPNLSTCVEEDDAHNCVVYGSKNDRFRYNSVNQGIPLTSVAYQSRLGVREFGTDITRFRAGDYSGYNILGRKPLEDLQLDIKDTDYVCRSFPEKDSPFKSEVKLKIGFNNVNTFTDDPPNNFTCDYLKYKNQSIVMYYPADPDAPDRCVGGTKQGNTCNKKDNGNTDCECAMVNNQKVDINCQAGVCVGGAGEVEYYVGHKGYCLDYDKNMPANGSNQGICDAASSNAKKGSACSKKEDCLGGECIFGAPQYQCLTYDPFK